MSKASDRKAEIQALQQAHNLKMATGIIEKIFMKYQDVQLNDPEMMRPNAEKEAAMLCHAIQNIAGKAVKGKHITVDQVLAHCSSVEQAPGLAHTFVALLAHSIGMSVMFNGPGSDKVQQLWNGLVA
jgi:hypothetical protein